MAQGDSASFVSSALDLLRRRIHPPWLLRVGRTIVAKAHSDALGLQAAALAFTTILSLVPLLAAFSVYGMEAFAVPKKELVELLRQVLPWSDADIETQVTAFLDQAATLGGFGAALFLLTCLAMFSTIETTLNHVWNVSRRRPLRNRLLSFSLVLFWGPLVIGATYALLFSLKANPVGSFLVGTLPFQLLLALVTILGLTMLYWLVPYTAVDFRAALVGGIFAGVLFTLLRTGFKVYVDLVPTLNLVYGGFGLALLFMISIQIAWWIALLGSVVAWCVQHVEIVDRRQQPGAPLDGSWIGLAALVRLTRTFAEGRPITSHERLAERLGLRSPDLQVILDPLVAAGILAQTGGDSEGVLLARDPQEVSVAEIFAVYEPLHDEVFEGLDSEARGRLGALRTEIAGSERFASAGSLRGLALGRAGDESEGTRTQKAAKRRASRAKAE